MAILMSTKLTISSWTSFYFYNVLFQLRLFFLLIRKFSDIVRVLIVLQFLYVNSASKIINQKMTIKKMNDMSFSSKPMTYFFASFYHTAANWKQKKTQGDSINDCTASIL